MYVEISTYLNFRHEIYLIGLPRAFFVHKSEARMNLFGITVSLNDSLIIWIFDKLRYLLIAFPFSSLSPRNKCSNSIAPEITLSRTIF